MHNLSPEERAKRRSTDSTLRERLVYRCEKMWLLRQRIGRTQKEMPASHLTWLRWENGRRWSAFADEQMRDLESRQEDESNIPLKP